MNTRTCLTFLFTVGFLASGCKAPAQEKPKQAKESEEEESSPKKKRKSSDSREEASGEKNTDNEDNDDDDDDDDDKDDDDDSDESSSSSDDKKSKDDLITELEGLLSLHGSNGAGPAGIFVLAPGALSTLLASNPTFLADNPDLLKAIGSGGGLKESLQSMDQEQLQKMLDSLKSGGITGKFPWSTLPGKPDEDKDDDDD